MVGARASRRCLWLARSARARLAIAALLLAAGCVDTSSRAPSGGGASDAGVADDGGARDAGNPDGGNGGGGNDAGPPGTDYVAQDLGAGRCTAVDDSGDALGTDESGAAFLLAAGQRTSLGALAGAAATRATALDASGATIVGYGLDASSRHALVHESNGWQSPAALAGAWASPAAVNRAGAVAGTLQVGAPDANRLPTQHAFLFAGGAVQDLGTLGGGSSVALAVSENGNVAGLSLTAAEDTHAFLFSGGKLTDLGTLGGAASAAYGVSSAGTVVGVSETASGEGHAFVFSGGAMRDLGLGLARSEARGVSEAGVVAGNWLSAAGATTPFVAYGGEVTPLVVRDAAGKPWVSLRLEAISSGGVIVGWGRPPGAPSPRCVVWRAK